MHLTKLSQTFASTKARLLLSFGLLGVVALVISACMPIQPMAESAAAEPTPTAVAEEPAAPAGDAVNGQYIATLTGGCGCHFNSDLNAMAGGREFTGTFGIVNAANITSDEATGIAHDSDEVLVALLRTGQESEDGEVNVLSPIMPYKTFSILSDKDAYDIVAWMRTLPPVENAVAERQLTAEPEPWTPANPPAAESPTEPVARGEYLVKLANCGGCHTPKGDDGAPKADMLLAGQPLRGDFASNLTPDEETGIGSWTVEQISTLLRTGTTPEGTQLEGAMAQQVERRFSKLTEDDAAAIAAYLKSIPAVKNAPPQ